MLIRQADVKDAPAIARVTVDTWKTAYRGIINNQLLIISLRRSSVQLPGIWIMRIVDV